MARYLIGAKGRLGHAIEAEFGNDQIISLDRAIYQAWSRPGAAEAVSRFFDGCKDDSTTIFVASGLLDPRLPSEDLSAVNYLLPRNVVEGATKTGAKVITFGTIMEGLLASRNPYIQSKAALAEYVAGAASRNEPVVHVQIHTLYGVGHPSPFMFLGQMLTSIREKRPFEMTSGRQLREYHHLADEARALRKINAGAALGVVNLSHGKPVSLRAIAENVFDAFGMRDLLRVGALPEPAEENYDKVLPPTELARHVAFRDSIPAIVDYMRNCHTPDEVKA
ncbi:NAD-dependent epimerase/dehydratase family protein [Bordetella genomosp. 13]|uniref:NAD-dependent epimerase/dehydratase domain-containing protein n=1 Tax=Bordetella genomosp. 13 TaxID=463040 RepID=A0A1W6Z6D2_9BORD|nr:NAD-dependent epimerase/dehydratase family protein [Bordetella genomosp. 13]ARP92909.1 hypothetical protein CAL15_00050 [Bordetella genomosp. 13]